MNNPSSASFGRTPLDDLTRLVSVGCDAETLGQCEALANKVVELLAVRGSLHPEGRALVLERVLTDVAREQRTIALDGLESVNLSEYLKMPAFRVAAAAELLNLTDEAAFLKVRVSRCKQFDVSWEELKTRPHNRKWPSGYLRAALWIGMMSARSVEPKRKNQPILLKELLSAVQSYLTENTESREATEERRRSREAIKKLIIRNLDSLPAEPTTRESGQLLAAIDDAPLSGSGDRDVLSTTLEQPPQSNSRTASNTLHEPPNRRESTEEGESVREQASDSRIHIWRRTSSATAGGRKTVVVSIAGALLALSVVIISWSMGNGESSVSGKGRELPASGNQASTGKPVLDGQPCLAGIKPDGDEPEVLDFQLPSGTTSTPCPKSVLVPITESTRKRPQVSRYAIQSGATTFHATLHVSSPFGASVEFKASTDNSSETHTISTGEEKEVSIPVAGAQTVELTTTIRDVGGEAVGYAVWGNAQFLP
jgi:hypothetical protein